MQFQQGKPAVGIVYDCDMGNTIDDALALALLFGLQGKGTSRVVSVSVSKPNLKAAEFCDVLMRFYTGEPNGFFGPAPIGMTLAPKMDPDTPMLSAPMAKSYSCGISKLNDTADPVAQIRNALSAQFDGNAVVVLAGPATNLAGVLDLPGSKELIKKKVKFLTVTNFTANAAAARKLLAEWPTPIFHAPKELGDALPFPGASIEKNFAWAPQHPIVDAYRAYKTMPYDAPSCAMAAALYAGRPSEGDFKVSDSGVPRELSLDPAKKDAIIQLYTELASTKPVPRAPRRRG